MNFNDNGGVKGVVGKLQPLSAINGRPNDDRPWCDCLSTVSSALREG